MKKLIIKLLFISLTMATSINSFANDIKKEDSIIEKIDQNSEVFKNSMLSEEDLNIQEKLIQKLNDVYFSKNNYNQEAFQEMFTNFIVLGFNKAAFLVLNDTNTKIDLNKPNSQGITPLIASAISNLEGGNVEMAKYLLEKGVDPNQTVKNNIPAISLAAVQDNYKVISLLILNNANFMAKDNLEMYPIDYAFKNKSEKSALILKNALDIHIENIKSQK